MTETVPGGIPLITKAKAARSLPPPGMRLAIRKSAHLTAADIAAEVGVTRQAVSAWERGKRTPRGERLHRYLQILQQLRELEVA